MEFQHRIREAGIEKLTASAVDTLQVNTGYYCNQACRHCHVEAGPQRLEKMSRGTAEQVVSVIEQFGIGHVDLTGGAPELNENFPFLVSECRRLGVRVTDRCNLTVLFEPGQEHLLEFLRDHQVEIVASLPYFLASNTDRQRGSGTFDKSLEALRRLNETGFGLPDSGLRLDLVYNPAGAFLPPRQDAAEKQFRHELLSRYGIVFNSLFTLTNMPIKRFRRFLEESGNYERYLGKLRASFNPATVDNLMCRTLISVGWDGTLYDCDFNQMLDMPVDHGAPAHLAEFDAEALAQREICTGEHCFGCTAGAGSSCGGALD